MIQKEFVIFSYIMGVPMRTRTQLYNSLLKYQVDLSFGTEISLLKHSNWNDSNIVLDYGCGNAYFSYCLSKKYPSKNFYCCDKDPDILKAGLYTDKMHMICGEFPNVELPKKIDFFLIRHLTSYLNDRTAFFEWIKEHAAKNASILLIDAYDENLIIEPFMPNFQKGLDSFYEKVEKSGGERSLLDTIKGELKNQEFEQIDELKIVVNSEESLKKEKLFIYMNLVAELDNGLPLSEEIREELMQWVTNPHSYVQYGLFVSLLQLKSK